jgi:hypothetical protein
MHLTARVSAVACATFILVACGGGGGGDSGTPAPTPTAPVTVGDTVALTVSGRLVSFHRAAPGTQLSSVAVTGLAAGEILLAIDRRAADGGLYALANTGAIYQLNPATGAATARSTLQAVSGDDNPFTTLSGSNFGIDFNPTVDRLRIVSNTGQNLRVNVDTGAATTDGTINPAGSAVTAAGYSNAFAGATSTQLYVLDAAAGRLHLQDPPNNGTLAAGVALGVTADAANGFDVDARTNTGYAALQVGGETALYTINLAATSAAATRVGAIAAGGEAIRGIALAPVAATTVFGLTADPRLVSFDPRTPGTLTSSLAVSGLQAGETLQGMDFRPRDGVLWGLTNAGRLYTIAPDTAVATQRGTLAPDGTDTTAPFTGIDGTITSVDFNPAADRLRVITSNGQSLRIVVETATANGVTVTAGHTTTDGTINRAGTPAPSVVASAYTNSFPAPASTSLYNLEQNSDQLTLQSPPNNGTLTNVGPLGVDVTGNAGFDIAGGANGLALAALRAGATGPFSLYTISLGSGAATLYNGNTGAAAQIGGGTGPGNLIDIAIRL